MATRTPVHTPRARPAPDPGPAASPVRSGRARAGQGTANGTYERTRRSGGVDQRAAGDDAGVARLVTGAASTAVRGVLDGPRRDARVLAAFPPACYLELCGDAEPRVLALVMPEAVRLPTALVVPETAPLERLHPGMYAQVGAGVVRCGPLFAGAARWWSPEPVLAAVTPDDLDRSVRRLESVCAASDRGPGLTGADGIDALAASCAADDLAGAVEQAERVVGLGPGLTPSGDDVLCGLLLALRLLGDAVLRSSAPGASGGGTAVRLADWIGAAVTSDATTRTTALSATLLHCAASGQASGEFAGVLRAMARPADGQGLTIATRRLLATGHTSGADLAWGLTAGCHAVTTLARTVRHAA